DTRPFPMRCAVVGRGRVGTALSAALGLDAPLGRGGRSVTAGAEVVLLAVPDAEIAAAAAAVSPGPLAGHLTGARTPPPPAPPSRGWPARRSTAGPRSVRSAR